MCSTHSLMCDLCGCNESSEICGGIYEFPNGLVKIPSGSRLRGPGTKGLNPLRSVVFASRLRWSPWILLVELDSIIYTRTFFISPSTASWHLGSPPTALREQGDAPNTRATRWSNNHHHHHHHHHHYRAALYDKDTLLAWRCTVSNEAPPRPVSQVRFRFGVAAPERRFLPVNTGITKYTKTCTFGEYQV